MIQKKVKTLKTNNLEPLTYPYTLKCGRFIPTTRSISQIIKNRIYTIFVLF